jgi:hypothetical protein
MEFFTRPLTVEPDPPPAELHDLDLLHLEHLRCDRRQTKAEFDAAARRRKNYEDTHKILDAISIFKGSGFKRVAAAKEHPEYGRLCAVEESAKRRWWASQKAVCDLEMKLGVIR